MASIKYFVPVEIAGPTGATAATRLAGGTATGAPVAGTWAVGDQVNAQNGRVWICTVAGTPGTWVDAGLTAFDATAPSTQAFGDTATTGSATVPARRDHKHAMPASPFVSGALKSAPPASSAPTLALGTAYQNTLGYDILLVVFLSVTLNTSGVVQLGVGPTSTPTQQTIIGGVSTVGFATIPIYLPSSYYALLSISGTITDSIAGQIAMPV